MPDEMEPMTYEVSIRDCEGSLLRTWRVSLFLQETREPSLNMLRSKDRIQLLDEMCEELAIIERTEPAERDHRVR